MTPNHHNPLGVDMSRIIGLVAVVFVLAVSCTVPTSAQQWNTPSISAPQSGSTDIPLNPIVSWRSQSGVVYNVQVSERSDFESFIISTSYKAETAKAQIMLSGLDYMSTYYIRVRVSMANVKGAWSDAVQFTTLEGPSTTPKAIFPVNGAVNQATRPTLKWRIMEDVSAYDVEVSPTTAFTSISFRADNVRATEVVSSLLSPTITYYWHVRPHIESAETDWSEVSSFTTGNAPYSPALQFPEHDAIFSGGIAKLEWQPLEGVHSYHVQISDNSTFDRFILDLRDLVGNKLSTSVPENTLLFWRVSAVNDIGEGTWSTWRSFRTQSASALSDVATIPELKDFIMHPNPVSSYVSFSFTIPEPGAVRMSIVDLNGTELVSSTQPYLQTGSYNIPMDLSDLPIGVYTYLVSYAHSRFTGKIMIVR